MFTATTLENLHEIQVSLTVLALLELTGWQFPPPAVLRNNDSFDYIIIGGGTAGSVITTRLVQKKYNVLLIEAGEDAPYECTIPGLSNYLPNSRVDWNYTTENDGYSYQFQANSVSQLGLGKMLGGSSEMNCMIYARGNPQNFDEWAEITNDTNWNWVNVLPFFKKCENVSDSAIRNSNKRNLFGTKGYIGVTRDTDAETGQLLEGFKQIGRDMIDDIDGNRVGYSRGLVTIYNGFRQGAGTRYLSQIAESRYIATAKSTTATKIIFDENKKAVGVEVITDEGKTIIVNARQEIIICAGVVKSPQLLMLSGIGPRKELNKFNITIIEDLPVGENLQNHVGVLINHKTNLPAVTQPRDPGLYIAPIFTGYASLNESANHKTFPDYKTVGALLGTMQYLVEFCASTYKFSEGMCDKLYDEADNHQVLVTLLFGLYGRSRGQVKLRNTNPMDPPIVIANSFCFDQDLEDTVDYVTDYLRVENSQAFKNLGATRIDLTKPRCDGFKQGSREYWRCHILCMMISGKAYSSTCAMGSVVDSRLRVKGVTGLRVADASVMPTLVTAYPYLTVVMIGEKAADIIIEDAGEYNNIEHEKIRIDQIKNMP